VLTFASLARTNDGICPSTFLQFTVEWGFSGSMSGHTFSVYRFVDGEDEDGTLVDSGGTGTSFVDEITDHVHDPVSGELKDYTYEVVIVRTSDSSERGDRFTPPISVYRLECL
jgi:hypothetical protein